MWDTWRVSVIPTYIKFVKTALYGLGYLENLSLVLFWETDTIKNPNKRVDSSKMY